MKINKPIGSVIMVVVALILIFLFLIPAYQKMNALQNELTRKQVEYDGKLAYYTKIDDLIKGIEDRKEALEKIDSALPSDFYFSSLVYFFQKESALAGLGVTSTTLSQISPPNKKTKIRDIIFNLNVSGTYDDFKNFLSVLDQSARLFEVNSVSFSTPAALQNTRSVNAASRTYNFDIEIQTHAY